MEAGCLVVCKDATGEKTAESAPPAAICGKKPPEGGQGLGGAGSDGGGLNLAPRVPEWIDVRPRLGPGSALRRTVLATVRCPFARSPAVRTAQGCSSRLQPRATIISLASDRRPRSTLFPPLPLPPLHAMTKLPLFLLSLAALSSGAAAITIYGQEGVTTASGAYATGDAAAATSAAVNLDWLSNLDAYNTVTLTAPTLPTPLFARVLSEVIIRGGKSPLSLSPTCRSSLIYIPYIYIYALICPVRVGRE